MPKKVPATALRFPCLSMEVRAVLVAGKKWEEPGEYNIICREPRSRVRPTVSPLSFPFTRRMPRKNWKKNIHLKNILKNFRSVTACIRNAEQLQMQISASLRKSAGTIFMHMPKRVRLKTPCLKNGLPMGILYLVRQPDYL